jgi:hypothetical protein
MRRHAVGWLSGRGGRVLESHRVQPRRGWRPRRRAGIAGLREDERRGLNQRHAGRRALWRRSCLLGPLAAWSLTFPRGCVGRALGRRWDLRCSGRRVRQGQGQRRGHCHWRRCGCRRQGGLWICGGLPRRRRGLIRLFRASGRLHWCAGRCLLCRAGRRLHCHASHRRRYHRVELLHGSHCPDAAAGGRRWPELRHLRGCWRRGCGRKACLHRDHSVRRVDSKARASSRWPVILEQAAHSDRDRQKMPGRLCPACP